MAAKLYMIQNIDTKKYYNVTDEYYTDHIYLATYDVSSKSCYKIIDLLKLPNCQVIELTEEEFMRSLAGKTTEAIILMDTLRKKLESIRYNLPTISTVNKNLGNFLKNTINALKVNSDSYFQKFEKIDEDSTYDVAGYYDEYIKALSKVEIYESKDLAEIIKAYKKDKASIMGIVKKVNR